MSNGIELYPLHSLLRARKSGRIIDPNRTIESEKILSLLEAGRWAPSCSNNQPWRFVVSRGISLEGVKTCLHPGNEWAKRAPLIVTVASKADLDCLIAGREYYLLGLGLAIENFLLQAVHLGLIGHPIAGFNEEKVKAVLKIPKEYRVHVLLIVGYPGFEKDVDESILAKEKAPRIRKPLEEIAFWERWGNAMD